MTTSTKGTALITGAPMPADAPVISVLRGGPHVRYAQTGRPQGAAPAVPAITVIRGGRSRPGGAHGFGHPGPLILRIPD